jgi:wyosine [tRNA(Phe)-imidazoG37] synthetase (radical SAM superfamily)
MATLTPSDHNRDVAGLVYVYPVVSRRAGGVSVGVNLNTNNACNWRCVYCQVPDLVRGAAPKVDLELLQSELEFMLKEILAGDFLETRVAPESRKLNDIALSGNGEPTSSRDFLRVVERIALVRDKVAVPAHVKTVLITNGSLLHRSQVQSGLERMESMHGQVWFKLDRGTARERLAINGSELSNRRVLDHLTMASVRCPTWVQTCMFAVDGEAPGEPSVIAYLELLDRAREGAPSLRGVLLYGLARQSFQPEAARLLPVPNVWLEELAGRIRQLGLDVVVTP